jgi:hypothetical protein
MLLTALSQLLVQVRDITRHKLSAELVLIFRSLHYFMFTVAR